MSFLAKIILDPFQASHHFKEGCVPSGGHHRTATEMERDLEIALVKGNGGIDLFGEGETKR